MKLTENQLRRIIRKVIIESSYEDLSSEEQKAILGANRKNEDYDESWDSHFESPEEEEAYQRSMEDYMRSERAAERRGQINFRGGDDDDWEAQEDLRKHDWLNK